MANSVVKGLTIEIGANTTKFTTAMKEIDKDARDISKDLKTVNESLKLDPSSAEKSADKLKLLQEAAQNASKKVDTIKEAIKKLNEQEADKSTDKYKSALADLERQLESAQREQDLANEKVRMFGTESESAGKSALSLADIIKGNVIASAITNGLSKVGDLFASLAKKAFDAAKAVANFAKNYANEAVKLAAAYQDQMGYSEQVFGKFAGDTQKWVEDNSVRLRIYKGDLLQYANEFGSLFNGFGYGQQQAMEMSETLISLAADLRAATGKDINEVIKSLTSGFTSSTKSLQQFGVVTNEAAIKAKALEMGLVNVEVNDLAVEKATLKVTEANKKASEALWKYGEGTLEYQKAQLAVTEAENGLNDALGGTVLELDRTQRTSALLQIVLETLNYLLGQSDKEADNYNSQLDAIDTTMKNLKETIGEKLLPVYQAFLDKVIEFLQSDAGKSVMDALADSVELLAQKVLELLEDEQMTEWISNLKDSVPQVSEKIIEFAEKIADLIPKVLDVTERLLALFGIKTEAFEAKEAFIAVQDELVLLANQYKISTDDATKAIETFAYKNGVSTDEIYKNWETYEPQIKTWMDTLTTDTTTATEAITEEYEKIPEELQTEMNKIKDTDLSGWDQFVVNYTTKIAEFATTMSNAWNQYCQPVVDWIAQKISWVDQNFTKIFGTDWETDTNLIDQSTPDWMYGGNAWKDPFRALGGEVSAGHMYQVNDDAGRRKEWFIPDQNGYILNGNQVDRMINSNNNYSRNVGDIYLYVNSYGTNVAEIADELGAAFNEKIRMSGTML